MDWTAFLSFLKSHEHSSILFPLLSDSKLEEITETDCSILVQNIGQKFYLDSKRAIVEEILFEFYQRELSIHINVAQKKTAVKKGGLTESIVQSPSLMEFQGDLEDKLRQSGLQPRFTFENFAVSPTNQMAHAASQVAAKNPATMYNPLFIYGDVGVGKTHLSQAVANEILKHSPRKKILYCTSEQFTNDLVDAIRTKKTQIIRDKYRKLDVLIVDDIQFIAGKAYVQEEFYHTFNTIIQHGGQIIMTSDRTPKDIKGLEDRLRSRFSGGLAIDMQKPDFELRSAIVLIKAQERKIEIDMKAAQSIAEKITDSRELEGALLKLLSLSLAQTDSNIITEEAATSQLQKETETRKARIRPNDIIRAVSAYYDIKPSHIRGSSRKQNIVMARQIAMYLLRVKSGLNLDEVAFITKRKDHTTILHGVEKIKAMIMKDTSLKEQINTIYENITAY